MSLVTTDSSKFLRGLQRARQRQIAAAIRGVNKGAKLVKETAVARCPKGLRHKAGKFLPLSGTAEIVPAVQQGDRIVGHVGFTSEHAERVHEDLDVAHANGQAKFLESTLRDEAKTFNSIVADEVKSSMS